MIWDIALATIAVIAAYYGIPVLFAVGIPLLLLALFLALFLLIGVLGLVAWIILQPIYFIHDRFFRKEEESDHA